MATQIAQATSVPASGASNAEDFQPQTRNPQDNVVPTQPQSSNDLQTPTGMDVLNDENLQINVPGVQSGQPYTLARSTQVESGANLFVIVVIGAVVVLGIGAVFSNRRKQVKPSEPSTPVIPPQKKPVTNPTPPKKAKHSKKSKSKRKRK